MIHHNNGDIIHEAAIFQTTDQSTISAQYAVNPHHNSHQIIECVADTGALKYVAILIQRAAPSRVAVIMYINSCGFVIIDESIIHHLIVLTTSQPAIIAHDASNIAAIIIAPVKVRAFAPTAGHILFATSLAHIFIAI